MSFISDVIMSVFKTGEGGISIMEYLRTEIKPDIQSLRKDHHGLSTKVAALPTRTEINDTIDKIHKRIDTKQDK